MNDLLKGSFQSRRINLSYFKKGRVLIQDVKNITYIESLLEHMLNEMKHVINIWFLWKREHCRKDKVDPAVTRDNLVEERCILITIHVPSGFWFLEPTTLVSFPKKILNSDTKVGG